MSVILFLAVLFVLILVHEWGHYIVAKKTGMRVDEFAIGFPPKVFSIKKGETEYSFNWLPIGGFVRIYGENLDTAKDTVDQPRSFAAKPHWAQALVLVAGVTMNVIFAWFLFALTFMIGIPTAVEEGAATPQAALYISGVLPESPLRDTLTPGTEIVRVSAGETVLVSPTPTSFTEFVQQNKASELIITYTTPQSETATVAVTPVAGLIPGDEERVAVGISLALVETVQQALPEAVISATTATLSGLKNITVGLYSLIVDSVRGQADFSQLAGPVGIVGLVGEAAEFGFTTLLTFTAVISLNLAVINMLPIPALDGGRLLFVAYEAVTRRPINPVWAGRMNLIGFVLLISLMVIVTWNDIARLI